MIFILCSIYVLVSLSGFFAIVNFFTTPEQGDEEGFDVSLGDVLGFLAVSFLPIAGQISSNFFWVLVAYRKFSFKPIIVFKAKTRPKGSL